MHPIFKNDAAVLHVTTKCGLCSDWLLQQTIAYACPVERRHVNMFARKKINLWNIQSV